MKKGGGSESTTIVGPSKSVLVYALHSLEYVLGLARFRVFVPKLLDNNIIQYSNSAKYLGMTLDAKLRWKQHVNFQKCIGLLVDIQLY